MLRQNQTDETRVPPPKDGVYGKIGGREGGGTIRSSPSCAGSVHKPNTKLRGEKKAVTRGANGLVCKRF